MSERTKIKLRSKCKMVTRSTSLEVTDGAFWEIDERRNSSVLDTWVS